MLSNLLGSLNFVDLLAFLIVIRFMYIGSIIGVGAQCLPLLWSFFAFSSLIVLYPCFSSWLQSTFSLSFGLSVFISLVLIFMVFLFIRILLSRLGKPSFPAQLINIEKYFGVVIAFIRSMFIVGIVCMFLASVPILEIEDKVQKSYFGEKILVGDTRVVYALVEHIPLPKGIKEDSDTVLNGLFRTSNNSLSIVKVFHLEPVNRKIK